MSLRFWTTRHIVIFIWIDRTDQDFYEVDFVLGTIPAVFIGVESFGPMRAEDIWNPAPTQNIEESIYDRNLKSDTWLFPRTKNNSQL